MNKKNFLKIVRQQAQIKKDEQKGEQKNIKILKDVELLALQIAAITGIVPGTHLEDNNYYFIDSKNTNVEYIVGVIIMIDEKLVLVSDMGYSSTESRALEYAANKAGFTFDISSDILLEF